MRREVEGPAVSSPVNTVPESGLFIPSEAEESHFLSRPLKGNRSTHSPLAGGGWLLLLRFSSWKETAGPSTALIRKADSLRSG